MCGRYEFKLSASKLANQIKEKAEELKLTYKTGEVFPNDNILCIVPDGSKVDLKVMKWGIMGKSFQINARVESLEDSFYYRQMKDRRCGIICNGFYEWDKDKHKYYFSTDAEYAYLAGIYNDKDEVLIVTTAADEEFAQVHERSPVVMDLKMMLDYIRGKGEIISIRSFRKQRLDDQISLF